MEEKTAYQLEQERLAKLETLKAAFIPGNRSAYDQWVAEALTLLIEQAIESKADAQETDSNVENIDSEVDCLRDELYDFESRVEDLESKFPEEKS